MKRFALCVIIGAVLGCDMPQNLRIPDDDTRSIIGISVSVKLYNALPKKQTSVYFVKLDEKGENNLGTKIIPCNYYRGNMVGGYYAFLVNAEPGRYAAVCSTKYDRYTASGHPDTTSKVDEVGFITFFDADMIKKTVVDVGPGEIAFMGSYAVESRLRSVYKNIEKNGDGAQQHYYNLLKSSMDGTYYCGAVQKADRSDKSTREFLVKSKSYFRNSDWLNIINATISALDKAAEGKMI
ncbi:MAG: hypothetical protein A2W19_16570 [Spirochaetes bacterium RBG_16_49_21]|nr:MAG: hypothetical protein A2W19_16570 [Spirochaetes bacterium RBG_16_49_21]